MVTKTFDLAGHNDKGIECVPQKNLSFGDLGNSCRLGYEATQYANLLTFYPVYGGSLFIRNRKNF